LLREFFEYADEKRIRGEFDVTRIARDYYRDELKPYFEENGHKASLFLKRFLAMTRQFVETDPRYQSRMDEHLALNLKYADDK
jgi:hypothetical protein